MKIHSVRARKRPLGFQPTLEILEDRTVPSAVTVKVTHVDEDHNPATPKINILTITGNSSSQGVEIIDHGTSEVGMGGLVTLNMDSTGDGTFDMLDAGPSLTLADNPGGISKFIVKMGGGSDTVLFDVDSNYGADGGNPIKTLFVDLGPGGKNVFEFDTKAKDISPGATVNAEVHGGSGKDVIHFTFGNITGAAVNIQAFLSSGSDSLAGPSGITFKGVIQDSQFDAYFDLGTGASKAFDFDFLDTALLKTTASSGTMATAVTITVLGSPTAASMGDALTVEMAGKVNNGASLVFNANLQAGNDSFTALFDRATFGVTNTDKTLIGGSVEFNVQGGAGADTFTIGDGGTTGSINLDGLLSFNLYGGAGSDTATVSFLSGAFTSSTDLGVLKATNHAFRMRFYGGDGSDTFTATVCNTAVAKFLYDIELFGQGGSDTFSFVGERLGGAFIYKNYILIDGGLGTNEFDDVSSGGFGDFVSSLRFRNIQKFA